MKIVKKYILKNFIKPFAGGLIAFLFIMVIAHFFDFLHTFLKYKPPLGILIKYFSLRLPQWLTTITPVAMLIGVLLSLGTMDKNNEITAIKSSGIKLIRVFFPLFVLSLFVSLSTGIINETIVPRTEPAADKLFERIKNNTPRKPQKYRLDIIYMGEGSKIYFIDRFEKETMTGLKLTEYYPGTFLEKKLIIAQKAVYSGNNSWNIMNGSVRTFSKDRAGEVVKYDEFKSLNISLSETPGDFKRPVTEPHKMGLPELSRYIKRMKRSGISTRREEVLYHYKIAFPFASTIILVLGIPIALFKGIHSMTISFFFALIISFIYWGALSVGRSMGINGILPPFIGAWSANIVFFAGGIFMMIKSRII
ncbi:MAG: LptF/LptG family permease [Elusimicrobia bacterium]|jgi:lipopolysaccharide export system permease protein|nr:LptF/LptG family permease [Elusimicrobiota bacterium]